MSGLAIIFKFCFSSFSIKLMYRPYIVIVHPVLMSNKIQGGCFQLNMFLENPAKVLEFYLQFEVGTLHDYNDFMV